MPSIETDHFESRVLAFERAWQRSPAPKLADFLPDSTGQTRAKLIAELICVDLEFRWRFQVESPAPAQPWRLDDYVAQLDELSSLDELPLELIGEEYRVRQLWGDRPQHDAFLARFQLRQAELKKVLIDIDRQLQLEAPPASCLAISESETSSGFAQAFDPRAPLAYGDYVLQRLIGAGGTGKVYCAWQRSLERRVAIKFLRKSLMRQPEAVERFIAEAKTIARLQHPGIVSVHGLGKTPVAYFLSMELIDGRDLASVVRDGPVAVSSAVNWIAQACDAVQHAHQRGVVHCDLKPGNLMLDRDGRVHVTDFGFARFLTENALVDARMEGTAPFMAPEQASEFWGPIDQRTDVYGLGAVLYALLTGRAPWEGRTVADVPAQVVSAAPAVAPIEIRADLSPRINAAVMTCLAKSPKDRFPAAGALRDALADCTA
jgi:tRNA A-37 threonylcarbamoyl transferase component Bud32